MPAYPQACLVRVGTSAVAGNDPCILYAVYLFAGSNASSLLLYDAASAAGTQVFEVNTVTSQGAFVDLSELGGISFPTTGIYATLAGTGAVAYLWVSNVGTA